MHSEASEDALHLDRLTVRYRGIVACDAISLRVRAGSLYALLGRSGSGKSTLLRCVLGEQKPTEGRVLVFGQDSRRERRGLRRRVRRIGSGSTNHSAGLLDRIRRLTPRRFLPRPSPTPPVRDLLERALGAEARLLVFDDVAFPSHPGEYLDLREALRGAVKQNNAVLIATSAAKDVEGAADRVGILDRGRLLLDEDTTGVQTRFRKIRYRNEITSTRTEYGQELDLFDAVRVRVRGWGVEAIVSNYSAESFERFRQIDGVVGAETIVMTLTEVFEALCPESPHRRPPP